MALFGALLGYGLGGNGQSAALGAAAGYSIQKASRHEPLFGGACTEGMAHSPLSGKCIKLGGKTHMGLSQSYSNKQIENMRKAIKEARANGYSNSSSQMKKLIIAAINK